MRWEIDDIEKKSLLVSVGKSYEIIESKKIMYL